MKHVYLIPYEGKAGTTWSMVLGIGAKRLIAQGKRNEHPFSYADGPRIMTATEQQAIFGEVSKSDWVADTDSQPGVTIPAAGFWVFLK